MFGITLILVSVMASPALAADGPFISLRNTNFIVLLSFLLFIAVLLKYKVPSVLTGLLDKRADEITATLNDARSLREEAQMLLASYERKQREVQGQADRIIAQAQTDANLAADQAKEALRMSVERRMQAAADQIASAEASAVKEIKNQAISVAIQVANEVMAQRMTAASGNKLIDAAIIEIDAKLH
jgi:F-type H+-transporting ATPase subunit b